MSKAKPGYHIATIEKGKLGEVSKIREECEEAVDAEAQGCAIMLLVELSDLYGAMRAYLETHHPSVTMADLENMNEITKRAFRNGRR